MIDNNPLTKYLRKPEIYVKLPSRGRWWPLEAINLPANGEVPVIAMTGYDDLMMRNADGLINGSTGIEVIQSCVPAVTDAWQGPTMDIEYLFIAIRIASYGHEMDIEKKCSKCNESTKYAVDLRVVLDTMTFPDFELPVIIDDLAVVLKPASFKLTNLTSQEVFEQQRAIIATQKSDLLLDQKEKILKDAIKKLSEITVSKLIEYIDYIMLPDGSRVSDRNHLQQFINQVDRKTFKALKSGIENKNKEYSIPKIPFKCHACDHEESFDFEFNPGNFFAADS
jgi:hypothetical protein